MYFATKLLGVLLVGGALYAYHEYPEQIEETVAQVGEQAELWAEEASQMVRQLNSETDSEQKKKHTAQQSKKLELPARMKGTPERIIAHTGYTLSFNREHNAPNWVAWELTAKETKGSHPRAEDFLPDPDVPEPHRVTTYDYKGSGYDRGHMVPAADMKWSARAMKECFYMSNMCPQNGSLNSGAWNSLENACRRWAQQEGSIYIVCGPVYQKKRPKKIGKNCKVSVPDGFFKAVLSTRKGHEKAIAFYYTNRAGKQPMTKTAMSVDQAEELTGINFFVHLPDKLENRIEASYSLKQWQ